MTGSEGEVFSRGSARLTDGQLGWPTRRYPSLEFRSFRYPEDLEQHHELFLDAFPEHAGSPTGSQAYHEWKYRSFPFDQPGSQEFVAYDDVALVGYYAALPYRYQLGGREARVGVVCDVMTHSRARGQGIFDRLGRYSLGKMAEQGIDLAVAFPVRPPSVRGLNKMGLRELFRLPVFIAPLRTRSVLQSFRLGALQPLGDVVLGAFRAVLRPRLRESISVRSVPASEFLDGIESDPALRSRYEDLLARWYRAVPNCLLKTPRFLRWRLGAPGAEYTCHVAESGGAWQALAITRCAELKGIPTCCILDWLVPEERRDAIEAIALSVEDHGKARSCELVATLMPVQLARRRRLGRMGFVRGPFVFRFVGCQLGPAVDVTLGEPQSWHLMWIDSDDL